MTLTPLSSLGCAKEEKRVEQMRFLARASPLCGCSSSQQLEIRYVSRLVMREQTSKGKIFRQQILSINMSVPLLSIKARLIVVKDAHPYVVLPDSLSSI